MFDKVNKIPVQENELHMAGTRGNAKFIASRCPEASCVIAIYNVPVYDYTMDTSAASEARHLWWLAILNICGLYLLVYIHLRENNPKTSVIAIAVF